MEEYLADQNVWVPKAPMIFGRFRFDAAYSGGSIYAFGGEVRVCRECLACGQILILWLSADQHRHHNWAMKSHEMLRRETMR